MILVDSRVGSAEVAPYIRKSGVKAEISQLPYGDFAMQGNGPRGDISIGVERKTLHDMLDSIDSARYVEQRRGMMEMYDKSFLLLEGVWKNHEDGTLMEGFKGGNIWGSCKYRSNRVMYSKLRRYMFSVSLSGVVVMYTRDVTQTAYDLCELYHYFSKSWGSHNSLLEISKLTIPSLTGRPTLVRRWAEDLTDIGTKTGILADHKFKTPIELANADELQWMKIKGVSVKTARQIVREIRTGKI